MVKHLVFFKLSPAILTEDKYLQVKKLEEIFSPLGSKLNYIVEFRTGINFNVASFAWDFAIDSIFRNREDLQKYQESDEHLEAVRKASSIGKTKAVIDYEF